MGKLKYHVYAPDGFESAHRSLAAAEKAAQRGANRRRMVYLVVACDAFGMTGGGHGKVVCKKVARYRGT
jgi:hypothetical protein